MKIIARHSEQQELHECLISGRPEFLAVYGRRRVGKTFLITEYFKDQIAFSVTGNSDPKKKTQLSEFCLSLARAGYGSDPPSDWLEAFHCLQILLEKKKQKRKVIFIDEVSWLDTVNSGFLSALEHFWNSWASKREDIVLVVCGSSSSWILKKIVNSYGGFHNGITRQIHLMPFTLSQCEEFAKYIRLSASRMDICELYMAIGGVPYYWSLLKPNFSVSQNMDLLFFKQDAVLGNEFYRLYNSLFKNADPYMKIVEILSRKQKGMRREEILKSLKGKDGGNVTAILDQLTEVGFIRKTRDFTKAKHDGYFQLVDFFTLFWLRFVKNYNEDPEGAYWVARAKTPSVVAWQGYSFEKVCMLHLDMVKEKLGISGVYAPFSSWRDANGKTQIDIILDRDDGIIELIESKFKRAVFDNEGVCRQPSAKGRNIQGRDENEKDAALNPDVV